MNRKLAGQSGRSWAQGPAPEDSEGTLAPPRFIELASHSFVSPEQGEEGEGYESELTETRTD